MYVCIDVYIDECMDECMDLCMYVCVMYVLCMYVCVGIIVIIKNEFIGGLLYSIVSLSYIFDELLLSVHGKLSKI